MSHEDEVEDEVNVRAKEHESVQKVVHKDEKMNADNMSIETSQEEIEAVVKEDVRDVSATGDDRERKIYQTEHTESESMDGKLGLNREDEDGGLEDEWMDRLNEKLKTKEDFMQETVMKRFQNLELLEVLEQAKKNEYKLEEMINESQDALKAQKAEVKSKEEEWMRKQEECEEDVKRLEVLLRHKIGLDVVWPKALLEKNWLGL